MDWRYRYSASGEREQKRLVYTAAWDSVVGYPWTYYLLGGSNQQLAVYHGQQRSGTGLCGDTGRRVYMYPAEYLTNGIGYTGTHEDISPVITDANGNKQFRISDHLASLRVSIDQAGTTHYDYDPWGAPLPVAGPPPSRRGYNDREKDRETGSYNLGVRQMDDRTGFWSVDPLWQKFPSRSPYVYANANPLRLTDPKGMQASEIAEGAVTGFFVDGPIGILKLAVDQFEFTLCPICRLYQDATTYTNPDTYKAIAQNFSNMASDPRALGEFGGKVGFDLLFFKSLAGVVATSTATVTESAAIRWNPLNGPGPLGADVASTFRSATYSEVVTDAPITLYRVYGGSARSIGSFWTRTPPSGPLQSIMDSALNPTWGNTATNVAQIQVPAGTTIYEGVAAPQGGLLGGGNQVYVPNVQPSWIVK